MPLIQVTMIEGRSVAQKHELIKRLTEATSEVLEAEPQRVRVVLYEVSGDDWGIGGEAVSRLRAPTSTE